MPPTILTRSASSPNRPTTSSPGPASRRIQSGSFSSITRIASSDRHDPTDVTGRAAMKNGFRVYDADTHVSPSAEVLERYLDPGFRPRLAELAAYRHDTGDGLHSYSFGRKFYRRVLGEAAPRETFTGRESRWRASKMPGPGVVDAAAGNPAKYLASEGAEV